MTDDFTRDESWLIADENLSGEWIDVDCDASGQHVVASNDNSYIYVSSTYGATWTPTTLKGNTSFIFPGLFLE